MQIHLFNGEQVTIKLLTKTAKEQFLQKFKGLPDNNSLYKAFTARTYTFVGQAHFVGVL